MTTLKRCIETYILAKDGNRPHLLDEAFATDAELSMRVKTDDISFPDKVRGREAISETMVRQFAQQYENVYTFCVGIPPVDTCEFASDWLVCMTEKEGGAPRLGYGQYKWRSESGLICQFEITIEEMRVLDRSLATPVLIWARNLPYPWCTVEQLARAMPRVDAVQRVVEALRSSTAAE